MEGLFRAGHGGSWGPATSLISYIWHIVAYVGIELVSLHCTSLSGI